ncbi:MAG: 2-C-methyl-D-erythritol 2,4-cyclodiphosphate synthase [Bacteroidia bacterium]|nr:2-C-methyl-D-erythritol 2,4-cyclodiphosphate synthase [Bacteroidia bacterium]
MRIGFGFDVHQLAEGRQLRLGGITIPHHKGAVGHSDADVMIHAICDALLGAANLGDIGKYFPDNSAEFKDVDSRILLKRVIEMIHKKKFALENIDLTLCLENPKIFPHIDEIRKSLSDVMKTDEDRISIKATTNEKLGYIGREEGVACYAVVLLRNESSL